MQSVSSHLKRHRRFELPVQPGVRRASDCPSPGLGCSMQGAPDRSPSCQPGATDTHLALSGRRSIVRRSIAASRESNVTWPMETATRLITLFAWKRHLRETRGLSSQTSSLRKEGDTPPLSDLGSHSICSASPELFVSRQGDVLSARPMKGTSPRGRTLADDRTSAIAFAPRPSSAPRT